MCERGEGAGGMKGACCGDGAQSARRGCALASKQGVLTGGGIRSAFAGVQAFHAEQPRQQPLTLTMHPTQWGWLGRPQGPP